MFMKKFLYRIILFLITISLLLGLYLVFIIIYPEYVNTEYYRFVTPRAHSLILGTSRAAVGIQPDIINRKIYDGKPILTNHAFSIVASKYGPLYFKELKQKIDTSKTNIESIFVLSVDPWVLSEDSTNFPTKEEDLWENNNPIPVGKLKRVDINPNFEYLWNYWGNRFLPFKECFKHLINYSDIWTLESNGWVNIDVPMDSATINRRIKDGIDSYKENKMVYNPVRFKYLRITIEYLSKYGHVYLVRIPITKPMYELETKKFPDFDLYMDTLVADYKVKYINMFHQTSGYDFVDHHHMAKNSALFFSEELADSIEKDLISSRNCSKVSDLKMPRSKP
jgi:hypothetical protein